MGGLFGGGGTSVTQQAGNSTEVTVDISNIIDAQVFADALKSTAGQTQELIASLSKAQIITQLGELKLQAEQNQFIRTSVKVGLLGGVSYFVWRKFYD